MSRPEPRQEVFAGLGEWITGSGEWINDHTHGQQFRVRFLKAPAPRSIEGIEKYLGSGMTRGIGPVYAKKLVLRTMPGEIGSRNFAKPIGQRRENMGGETRATHASVTV